MVMPSGFSSTYTCRETKPNTTKMEYIFVHLTIRQKNNGEVKEKRWQKVFLRGVCSGKGDTSHLLQPREKKKPNPCTSYRTSQKR